MSMSESLSPEVARAKWTHVLSHRRETLALGGIFALALAMRLYGITSPPVDFRSMVQTYTALVARGYSETGQPVWQPALGVRDHSPEPKFPLYEYTLWRLYFLFGEHEWLGRLLSVACSLGALWFLHGVGRRWYGPVAGLWTALFFAVTPASVYFGRSIQPEAMMLLFSAATMYFFARWMDEQRSLSLVMAGACWTLAVLVKLIPAFLFVPLGYLWFCRDRWRFLRSWRFWLFLGVCGTLPTLWYASQVGSMCNRVVSQAAAPNRFTLEFYLQVFINRMGGILLTPVGYLVAVLGLLVKVKHKKEYALHWWFFAYIFYFFVAADVCFRVEYYMLPIILPGAVSAGRFLAGASGDRIWDDLHGGQMVRRWLAHPASLLALLLYFSACGFGVWIERRWFVDYVREIPPLGFMLKLGLVISTACLLVTLALLPLRHKWREWCRGFRPRILSGSLMLVIALSSLIYLQPLYLLRHDVLAAARWIQEHTKESDLLISCCGRSEDLLYCARREGWGKHWSLCSAQGIERRRKEGAAYYVTTLVDEFNAQQDPAEYLYAHYRLVYHSDDFLVFDLRKRVPAPCDTILPKANESANETIDRTPSGRGILPLAASREPAHTPAHLLRVE